MNHEINFTIPLSNSKLFDTHVIFTAKKLCDRFTGLYYTTVNDDNLDKDQKPNSIKIFGMLSDSEYTDWCRIVFEIGNFEV